MQEQDLKRLGHNANNVKRDKFDIVLKILAIAREPIKKTHVIYKANINFAQLVRYLDFLVSLGMIEVVESPFKGYRTTDKGVHFLQLFNYSDDLIGYRTSKVPIQA